MKKLFKPLNLQEEENNQDDQEDSIPKPSIKYNPFLLFLIFILLLKANI